MRHTVKTAILFCALSLCIFGAIFSPREPVKDREPATQLQPVNNRQPHRIWLRA
jgi:hypothetical protein